MADRVLVSLAKRRRMRTYTQGGEECLAALAIACRCTEDEAADALARTGTTKQVFAGIRERMLIAGGELPESP